MHITAVRHGETNENALMIVQGQVYGTLSEKGLQQIQQVGKLLAESEFDVCFSSDLERCRLTAEAILQYHPDLPVHFDARLRERSMKPMEGLPFADVQGWDWENDKYLDHKTPEGETWADVITRVGDCLNEIFSLHADKKILIVSHGGPMRAVQALLSGEKWEIVGRMMIDNCEVREWEMTEPVNASDVRSR